MASLFDGFRMILIDIIVLWKEKKDVYYFWKENAWWRAIFPSDTKKPAKWLTNVHGPKSTQKCTVHQQSAHKPWKKTKCDTDTNLLRNGESVASQNSSDEVANIRVYLVGENFWVLVL